MSLAIPATASALIRMSFSALLAIHILTSLKSTNIQTQTCLVLMKQFIILLCGSIKDCDPKMCEKLIILIQMTQKVNLVFKN